MRSSIDLNQLSEAQLRDVAAQLQQQVKVQESRLAEREACVAQREAQR